jgi:type I restriction enzyme S subunit
MIAAFDAVAEAPDGVVRLRELVLQLAVQGKLVPQDPSDEPAIAVVRRARAEQVALVTSKGIPAPPPTTEIGAANVPHELPENWVWAPLGHVVAVLDFMRRPIKQADREAITSGKPQSALYPYYGATQQAGWIDEYIFDEELVLLGEDGAPFFKPGKHVAYVVSGRYWVNNHAHALRGLGVLNSYICRVLNQTSYEGLVSGTTRLKLTQAKMVQIPVPVAPLAEQHRIVARVDELMGLLDQLEAARTTRDATRTTVRDSVLDALREADTPDEVEVAWTRFAERLDDLLGDPTDVAPLRQTVLQLAVRGRLAPQDPTDEPASVLLERIAAEKARLVKAETIPSQQPFPPVSRDDVPFDAPEGWAWCRVDDCFAVAGGIQKSGKRRPVSNAFPYLRVANVQRGTLDLREIAKFELFNGELERLRLRRGDLLVVEGNGSETEIGRCARWDGEIDDCVHQNHIIRCRPLANGHEQFVLRFLNSPTGMDIMKALAVTTSGLYTLSVGKVRSITMPVPPLAEQHRIVARVDELMGLLDRLEARLTAARTAHTAFAAAAVHHLDA